MQRFTHITIVRSVTQIRRERLLPVAGEVVARIHQEVTPVQVVARAPQQTEFHVLPASDLLQIQPSELAKHLLVKEGDSLEQGMPLVRRRRFLGGKSLISPVDGVVYAIKNGRLILQQISDWVELRALMSGRVVNHIPDRGVVLQTNGTLIQAVWGSGRENHGKLKVVTTTADAPLLPDQINAETTGYVLVAGRINHLDALRKAEENGVRGLIAGGISSELYSVAPSITFPILISDGIGDYNMAEPIFQLLQKAQDREASLFGQAPDAWGNRPEIIIPVARVPGNEPLATHKPLAIGQTVRLLRPPYNNRIGEVVRLYQKVQATPIGTKVHGADVKLSDGFIVFVPYPNLDALL